MTNARDHPSPPTADLAASWISEPFTFPLNFSVDSFLGDANVEWDAVLHGIPQGVTGPTPPGGLSGIPSPPSTIRLQDPLPTPRKAPSNPEQLLMAATQEIEMSGQPSAAAEARPSQMPAVQPDRDTISGAIRQLADLSVELYHFALTIPPVSVWEESADYQLPEGKEFALDRILKLSQLFIETLNKLCPQPLKRTASTSSDDGTSATWSMQSSAADAATTLAPDQSCDLLALSSYVRIFEIYHAILEHVAACAQRRRMSQGDSRMSLPSLAIGSFTMESSSATQVLVLVHLIEVMMTRSRDIIQSMVRARGAENVPSTASSWPDNFSSSDGSSNALDWDTERVRRLTPSEAMLEGFRPKEKATLQLARTVKRIVLELGYE